MKPFFYFFIAATAAVVILTERLESLVINKFFRGFVDEIRREEAELNEYYALSILAIALNDREAYEGLQRMANEKYWPLFFRNMMFSTSLFFLLLTPYMLITHIFLSDVIPNPPSWVIFTAVLYFTIRLGYSLIRESYNAWKAAKLRPKF